MATGASFVLSDYVLAGWHIPFDVYGIGIFAVAIFGFKTS